MLISSLNADTAIYMNNYFQEFLRDQSRIEKILQLHYLICLLLPVLEQINQDQRIELEIEAKIRGDEFSW